MIYLRGISLKKVPFRLIEVLEIRAMSRAFQSWKVPGEKKRKDHNCMPQT